MKKKEPEITHELITSKTGDKMIAKTPEWVRKLEKKEDMANAMFAAAQEFMLVVEDALMRYHQFNEAEIKKLRNEIKPVLEGVAEYEKHGLSLLSPADIGTVAEIADTRLTKETLNRVDIETPVTRGALPFIKALKNKFKN